MEKIEDGNSLAVERAHTNAFCARKVCLDFQQSDPLRHASKSAKKITHIATTKRCTRMHILVLYTRKLFFVSGQHKSCLPCFPLAADLLAS